jgi:hypothetical protein
MSPRKKKKLKFKMERQWGLVVAFGVIAAGILGYALSQQSFGRYLLGQVSGGRASISCSSHQENMRLDATGVAKVPFQATVIGPIDTNKIYWSFNEIETRTVEPRYGASTIATFASVGRKTIGVTGFGNKGASFQANCGVNILPALSANPTYQCVGPTKAVTVGQTVAFSAKRNDGEVVKAVWNWAAPSATLLSSPHYTSSLALSYSKPGSYKVSFVDPQTNKSATCATVKVNPRR